MICKNYMKAKPRPIYFHIIVVGIDGLRIGEQLNDWLIYNHIRGDILNNILKTNIFPRHDRFAILRAFTNSALLLVILEFSLCVINKVEPLLNLFQP